MTDFENGPEIMDIPEIVYRLFYPRRDFVSDSESAKAINNLIPVTETISLGCRFYPSDFSAPCILYFHGNGETAPDYDEIAPFYQERSLNLFVADYRGYGMSTGTPSCSTMVSDAHATFSGFCSFLRDNGYTGHLFVMGRSLGSAPALEVAYHHQGQLKGLIIESGFAGIHNQLQRLGVSHLFDAMKNPVGFGNDLKIREVIIPTLIIHGEADTIIPAIEGRTLYDCSGVSKKTCLFIPFAGHNDLMVFGLETYMSTVKNFIDHCIT